MVEGSEVRPLAVPFCLAFLVGTILQQMNSCRVLNWRVPAWRTPLVGFLNWRVLHQWTSLVEFLNWRVLHQWTSLVGFLNWRVLGWWTSLVGFLNWRVPDWWTPTGGTQLVGSSISGPQRAGHAVAGEPPQDCQRQSEDLSVHLPILNHSVFQVLKVIPPFNVLNGI